ncbi:MAG: ParB N-terminal domain-containing protein [Planctomycetaceae bacterium]|jgi:hypothetical protein|nr:ParB N-terminal domain-containing protein [Planctomycetaceae bacterium]MBT6153716.1 ParB N-terminal domain-containing protein [Planctomycetaceae bacterium]MBT6485543.1 ParB N-terminal domain-containing protein [Planctomycetaceae bacterium]MBT6494397.1 ParB N-terminal domain-containing protein [Planctomycetaceae bacterium]
MIASTPDLSRYAVRLVSVDEIKPSPENDDLYGNIAIDGQFIALVESIKKRGLEEPLILTADGFILSGHRRFHAAVEYLMYRKVPCRIRDDIHRENNPEFHTELAEYNPHRVKTVGSLLKEALLRDKDSDDTYSAIREYHETSSVVTADFMEINGTKHVLNVSKKKRPFLTAVQKVIGKLRDYWPLSIRQIHYNLLNKPPLISTPKRSIKPPEHYRYRNDKRSYTALVSLLKSARYHGHVSMTCIDDPTRPESIHTGWGSVSEFVQEEIAGFLDGYHRHRQDEQPRHIEMLCEKNTVLGMLRRVSREYYVPLTAGRGFCSIPVWRKMNERFRQSGRDAIDLTPFH